MALTTTFPDNNLSQVDVYALNDVKYRYVESLVAWMNPAFRRSELSKLAAQLGKPVQKETGNRLIEMYRQAYDYPMATIAGRTASGSDLVLTFTDSTFNSIVVDSMVQANNGTLGVVKSVAQGSMTIGFLVNPNNSSATAFAAGDFAAGEFVVTNGNIGDTRDRKNPIAIDPQPLRFTNIIGQKDASVTLNFDDLKTKTWLPFNGKQYFAFSKLQYNMEQFLREYDKHMLSDVPAIYDSQKPVSGSLIWQIRTQGGIDRPFTTLNKAEFLAAADDFRNTGGNTSNEVLIVCGSGYLAQLQQTVFENFVLTAGTNNVVGGVKVKGIDVVEYAYAGFNFKFLVDRFLDQPVWTPTTIYQSPSKRSFSALWMSTGSVPSTNGGMLPFICEYYFGNKADVAIQTVNGMIDKNGNYVENGSNGKKAVTYNMTLDKTTVLSNPTSCMFHYVSA